MSARSFCTPPKDPSTRAGQLGSIGRNTQDIEAGLDGLDGDGDGNITREEWILKYGSAGDALIMSVCLLVRLGVLVGAVGCAYLLNVHECFDVDGFQEFDTSAPYGVLQGSEIDKLNKVDNGSGRPRYWETDSWRTERCQLPVCPAAVK